MWPDFNVSRALDLVLVLAREAPQDCLRGGMTYLPLCDGDLMMESGCCSLQCRAALQKVPVHCWAHYLLAICANLPDLSKYLFNLARRCTGLEISCQVFNFTTLMLAGSGRLNELPDIPIIATEEGDCPIETVMWPDFNQVQLFKEVLGVLPDSNASAAVDCGENQHRTVAQIYTACNRDLRVQTGCCSHGCALAMRSMSTPCLQLYMRAFHSSPVVKTFIDAMYQRCMGSNTTEMLGNYSGGAPGAPGPAAATAADAGAGAGGDPSEAAAAQP
ncbi:hypothetical protein FOA52_005697 [Chlamydomonas sp. UWO 241]|nr:hypothetical protein FOA52_005697 [Chlamydomonas sp. UWO 241]